MHLSIPIIKICIPRDPRSIFSNHKFALQKGPANVHGCSQHIARVHGPVSTARVHGDAALRQISLTTCYYSTHSATNWEL